MTSESARPTIDCRRAQPSLIPTGWHAAALLMVVTAALAFRLVGIGNIGIRFDDEGAYVGDARLWHRCALVLTDGQSIQAVIDRDKAALQQRMSDLGVDFKARYAKPSQGYTFMGAVSMFAFGDGPLALVVLNSISGVLAVLVLYFMGAMLFGPGVGLCGALFLAVSPYHLLYCRSAFPDATAGFLALLGLCLVLLGVRRNWSPRSMFLLGGFSFGIAITCHYRTLYVPCVVALADGLLCFARRGENNWRSLSSFVMRRWLWLAVGMAIPAVLIELVFRSARLFASISDSFFPLETYFEAWVAWMTMVVGAGKAELTRAPVAPLENAWTYVGYFVHWHGIALTCLAALGLLIAARTRGLARMLVLFVVVSIALLMNQPFTVARGLSTALPVLSLMAAVGVMGIVAKAGFHRFPVRVAVVVATALLVVPSLRGAVHLCEHQSGVAEACAFIASKGPARAATPLDTYHRSKYWLHLEGTGVDVVNGAFHKMGDPADVVARLRKEGVRWFIIDPQRWHFRDDPPGVRNGVYNWWDSMDVYLSETMPVAAEFSHVDGFGWEFLSEGPGLTYLDEMIARHAGRLRVYDLDKTSVIATR